MTIRTQCKLTAADFSNLPVGISSNGDSIYQSWSHQASGQRNYTSAVVTAAIRARHPGVKLTVINAGAADLLAFADSGRLDARATLCSSAEDTIVERIFTPPARRYEGLDGAFSEGIVFAAYDYCFDGAEFLLYVAYCSDGDYSRMRMQYLLESVGDDQRGLGVSRADDLIKAATTWGLETHNEILMFDMGNWQKDSELWKAVQKASWDDVILDEDKKNQIINDVEAFFSSEADYKEFAVPWKRGVIFFGPPGNGKSISTKALMHSISNRTNPTVEILYVKTLSGFMPPEYMIRTIFTKARAMAPCMLIFEDIDSLINMNTRSYFLNEVDGLESNHGILMIGTTNYLEMLDPGISKRPSRFDRKYLFDLPTRDERVQYCEYWRAKLKDNKEVAFPPALCGMIADITDDFSFAYLKEAFVASLLVIVASQRQGKGGNGGGKGDGGKDEAEKSILWKEIQKQVKLLREELGNETNHEANKTLTTGLDVSPLDADMLRMVNMTSPTPGDLPLRLRQAPRRGLV